MANDKEQKNKKTEEFKIEIKGIDIDKNEYHEIILSNSNHPDKDFYNRNYYD